MQQHLLKAKESVRCGALYVVATPIGNLSDISLRALAVLERADVVCAEDTRVTARLLAAYGIRSSLISVREHNEQEMAQKIIARLQAGEVVAQVSDAGTPAICDPGARLVQAVRTAGLAVYPIPGASAVTAALSAAGLVAEDFYFGGFLPAKKSERQKRLTELYAYACPVVVYETPHRIADTLRDMSTLPERTVTLARELTKTFETMLSGSPQDLLHILDNDTNQSKGEMVLLLHPLEKTAAAGESADVEKMLQVLAAELPTKHAAQLAAQISGLNKKTLYERILTLKNTP
ncbi:MAG: 16S rRNA (cytidine(1402)-2'-O)-methyltransferase [Neisseria sp.]|nr:16S rRNA (cytidine(1402)-2'-O)-methyltransferase [Neisseria sp.]